MKPNSLSITGFQEESSSQKIALIKLATGIFFTCLILYLLTYSGRQYSIDGIVMFQSAKAILFDGSFMMDPPVQWGIEFSVSKWPVGMTVAYISLLFALSKTLFVNDPSIRQIPYNPATNFNLELLENRPYLYSAILNPFFTAASAVILFLLCHQIGLNRKQSAAIALIYGLASPAAVYAKLDYAQPMAACFLLLAFFLILLVKTQGVGATIGAGISMGITILARPELAILYPILAGASFFLVDHGPENQRRMKKRLVILAGFTVPLIVIVILNLYINSLRFGSWTSVGYQPVSEFTLNPARNITTLAGNLVSPGRGIFIYFPISIFAIAGLRQLRHANPLFTWTLVAVFTATLTMYSAWRDWGAGVSWGPRFFIPIMPYLALAGFLGLENLRSKLKSYYPFLAGLILLLGWVVALQGLLFRFTDFYSSLNLPPKVIDRGDYNFLPYNSPILRGWDHLARPGDYDIFWLGERIIQLSEANMFWIPFLSLLALGFAIKSWIDFFRSAG